MWAGGVVPEVLRRAARTALNFTVAGAYGQAVATLDCPGLVATVRADGRATTSVLFGPDYELHASYDLAHTEHRDHFWRVLEGACPPRPDPPWWKIIGAGLIGACAAAVCLYLFSRLVLGALAAWRVTAPVLACLCVATCFVVGRAGAHRRRALVNATA
jgi:hypothetical protein